MTPIFIWWRHKTDSSSTVRDGSPIATSIRQLKIKVLSTHLDLQFTKYFQYVLKMSIMYSNMHFKNPTYCTFSIIQIGIYEITIIIFINSTWLFIYQLQKVLHWYCSFYALNMVYEMPLKCIVNIWKILQFDGDIRQNIWEGSV